MDSVFALAEVYALRMLLQCHDFMTYLLIYVLYHYVQDHVCNTNQ